MEIRIEGFNHKLPLLVERIFNQLAGRTVGDTGGSIGQASFDREKEALERRYRNANMQVRPPRFAFLL